MKETNCAAFWDPIFETDFADYIENRYALGQIKLMDDEIPEDEEVNLEFVVEE